MYVPGRRSRGRPRGHEERMQRNRLRCGDPWWKQTKVQHKNAATLRMSVLSFLSKKKKKGRTKDYRKYDLLYTNSCFLCNWQLNLLGRFCVMCFLCRAPRCSSAARFSSCGRACRRKWWELSHIKGCTTVPKHPLTPVKQFYHLAKCVHQSSFSIFLCVHQHKSAWAEGLLSPQTRQRTIQGKAQRRACLEQRSENTLHPEQFTNSWI